MFKKITGLDVSNFEHSEDSFPTVPLCSGLVILDRQIVPLIQQF